MENKDKWVNFRASDDERLLMQVIAYRKRCKVSQLLRELVWAEATQEDLRQVEIANQS